MHPNRIPNTICASCGQPCYLPPVRIKESACCSRACQAELTFTTHERRIEALEGMPFGVAVQRRYFDDCMPAVTLYERWGLQFRSFRDLLERHGIPMKSHSRACKETWIDADSRRQQNGEYFRERLSRFDFTGDNNPAKRPEVRAKISAARKLDNPMWRPEVAARAAAKRRAYYEVHPEKHPNRFWGRFRRSRIEQMMDKALRDIGIHALYGQRIGRRWPDLMIRDARLVVECDGTYWHTPEADAIRDAELQAAGWTVLHFTDEEIVADVARCARDVQTWLIAHGFPPNSETS